jgi:trigger factor
MKTEIVDVSPTRKELKIEIAAEDVRAEYDRVTGEYAQSASVPGFRKGHAPAAVVRTRFKKDIQNDVLRSLIPDAVERAINESGIEPIGQPDVHLDNEGLGKFGQEPISLHAHVEVMPVVPLSDYKGVEASRRLRPVTDEVVERVISDLRESSASLQPIEDRGAEDGDTVTIDVQGRYLVPPEDEDINAEAVDVVVGGEGVLPVFTENLRGASPDEVRTFSVEYPADFNAQGLAGKTIEYTATVTAVRRKEVPELDDEWVKSLGEEEVDTVEKLYARVRENLSKNAENESEHRLRDELLGKLIAGNQFEVPETLVEYQSNQLLQSTINDMIRRGVDPRSQELNWEALREVVRARAEEDLRGSLLLERIAEAEGVEVSEEEIESEIQAIATGTNQSVEQVRAALTKQGGERSIADRLRNRKALDLIVKNAAVCDAEWDEESPADEVAAAAGGEAESGGTDAEEPGEVQAQKQPEEPVEERAEG